MCYLVAKKLDMTRFSSSQLAEHQLMGNMSHIILLTQKESLRKRLCRCKVWRKICRIYSSC